METREARYGRRSSQSNGDTVNQTGGRVGSVTRYTRPTSDYSDMSDRMSSSSSSGRRNRYDSWFEGTELPSIQNPLPVLAVHREPITKELCGSFICRLAHHQETWHVHLFLSLSHHVLWDQPLVPLFASSNVQVLQLGPFSSNIHLLQGKTHSFLLEIRLMYGWAMSNDQLLL